MAPSVVLSVRVSPEVAKALERHAETLQISKTALVRELLEVTLLKLDGVTPRRIRRLISKHLLLQWKGRESEGPQDSDLPLVALNPIFPGQ